MNNNASTPQPSTPVHPQLTPVQANTPQPSIVAQNPNFVNPPSPQTATPPRQNPQPATHQLLQQPQPQTPQPSQAPEPQTTQQPPTPPPSPKNPQAPTPEPQPLPTPHLNPNPPKPKKSLLSRLLPKFRRQPQPVENPESTLAQLALHSIADGVILLDKHNQISLINPAAVQLTAARAPEVTLGLPLAAILQLETLDSGPLPLEQTPLFQAILRAQPFTSRDYLSVTEQNHKVPIAITLTPAHGHKILTFRDITKELAEEDEQAEFISTASHEMRTPVASIEGYIGLAMNPQTATIDDRARQYLDAAHSASQHLGHLFKDLLDVTKLDDKKLKVHPAPIDLRDFVEKVMNDHTATLAQKSLKLTFGSTQHNAKNHLSQPIYVSVDVDFLREILDNLIENAAKYTPEGGAIWVNVRADGDEALINVTDTGIGIAPDDLTHIFQKFYRADNSQTRTIGGTGLGLYLVKQRVEAMHGRVWAESSFGDGSTFYVAFPRLDELDYQRAKLAYDNNQAMRLGATTARI